METPKTFKELFANSSIEPTTDESGNTHYNFKATLKEKQQQKMYSEEDLKEAFKSCYTPFSFDRIGDLDQDFNIWFEQFKKK